MLKDTQILSKVGGLAGSTLLGPWGGLIEVPLAQTGYGVTGKDVSYDPAPSNSPRLAGKGFDQSWMSRFTTPQPWEPRNTPVVMGWESGKEKEYQDMRNRVRASDDAYNKAHPRPEPAVTGSGPADVTEADRVKAREDFMTQSRDDFMKNVLPGYENTDVYKSFKDLTPERIKQEAAKPSHEIKLMAGQGVFDDLFSRRNMVQGVLDATVPWAGGVNRLVGGEVGTRGSDGKGVEEKKKRAPSKWMEHVKAFHGANKHLTYKQAMQQAKHSYQK
jgi:hypothetical protein